MENELQEDQSDATIEKAYTTAKTYKRILNKRVIPRFGRKSPLAEKWLKEMKRAESLENPTLDKIRRVMNLVYKHGQRYGLIPRDESVDPMNWVRQKTTSSYTAVIMNPPQAFEILLNIPKPRRTLVLTGRGDSSASVGGSRSDVDGSELRRSGGLGEARVCLGSVQSAQVESLEGACAHAPGAGGLSDGLEGADSLREGWRLRVPKFPA